MLHILGLTTPEIHYTIGHEIEDPYETRNEYVNEERLYQIKKQLEQRPIFGDKSIVSNTFTEHLSISSSHCNNAHFRVPAAKGILCFSLQTLEPGDSIKIQIRCKGKKRGQITERHMPGQYGRTINILETLHKQYKK